ncbi:MAG: oxidoreductase [Cyclobacteriaceae bacterium]|nr:MAG: oxidoreductase [Cyclobacteriaceae bacterium]
MKNPETRLINGFPFVRYTCPQYASKELISRSAAFYEFMNQRRSVRDFSDKPIPREVINNLILTASTAPSGAHKQPWTFCVVEDAGIKKEIRKAAEEEEYRSYTSRMSEEWLNAIKPLQTDWHKPFLETAPCLIVVFRRLYELNDDGSKSNNYYVSESTGLACGFLLAAIHHAGLVALTHTPNPMNFLTAILKRPENERPFLLIPVGYAAEETYVPDLTRKKLSEIAVYY